MSAVLINKFKLKIGILFQMSSADYNYTSLLVKYLDGIQNKECKYYTTNLERFRIVKKQFLAYKHDFEIRHREIDLDIVELITDRYHI